MKKHAICLGATLFLAGCSFSPLIQSDSIDFGSTLDLVSNQLLVTNILRARDHAPLHFANLSSMHAQFQGSISAQSVLPFGAFSRTAGINAAGTGTGSLATRPSNTDILQLQTTPSFDFAPLDTQEFTRGILTPIDPQVAKYYFDRDLPQELLLFLLVDRIVPTPAQGVFPPLPNAQQPGTTTAAAPDSQELINDPERPDKFAEFAKWAASVFGDHPDSQVIVANSYLSQIGPAIEGGAEPPGGKPEASSPQGGKPQAGASQGGQPQAGAAQGDFGNDEFKDFSTFDASKAHVECFDTSSSDPSKEAHCNDKTSHYRMVVYGGQPNIIFCAREKYFFVPLPLVRQEMNEPATANSWASEMNIWKQLCTSEFAPGASGEQIGAVYLRSVEGMIQYLGALISGPNAERNQKALRAALGYTLFDLAHESDSTRFGVSYDGQKYYVRDYDPKTDRTLLTLALVSQLLNLSTKASEIPTTRSVEIVP